MKWGLLTLLAKGHWQNFNEPIKIKIKENQPNVQYHVRGATYDITERKQIEEALRHSEEKFRTLVEESPLGISLIDTDDHYKYVNPAFREMLGYSLEDIPTGAEWFRKAYPDKTYRHEIVRADVVKYVYQRMAGNARRRGPLF